MTGPVISGASILGGRRELSRVSSSLLFALLIQPGPSGPPATRPGLSFLWHCRPLTPSHIRICHSGPWSWEHPSWSGVPPGGAAGSQLSTPRPSQAGARLGPLAPQGSIIPSRPLLPSSAPLCPVACGKVYSSDFQGALRCFRINAWLHHCLLWMR